MASVYYHISDCGDIIFHSEIKQNKLKKQAPDVDMSKAKNPISK